MDGYIQVTVRVPRDPKVDKESIRLPVGTQLTMQQLDTLVIRRIWPTIGRKDQVLLEVGTDHITLVRQQKTRIRR